MTETDAPSTRLTSPYFDAFLECNRVLNADDGHAGSLSGAYARRKSRPAP